MSGGGFRWDALDFLLMHIVTLPFLYILFIFIFVFELVSVFIFAYLDDVSPVSPEDKTASTPSC